MTALSTPGYLHVAALDAVKERLGVAHSYFDAYLLEFLRNKEYDVDETVAKVHRRYAMERDEFAHYTVTASMMHSMTSGVLQLLPGCDRAGLPVVYIVTRRDSPKAEEREERRKNLDMWLSYVTKLTPQNPACKVTWLINQKGASLWANTDLTFQREILTRIAKYFPYCQHKVIVCNMSNALSFVVKPLVRAAPEAVSESIVILSESNVRDGKVMEFIDREFVPVSLGGLCDCDNEVNWKNFGSEVAAYTEELLSVLRRQPYNDGRGVGPIKVYEMMSAFHVGPDGLPSSIASAAGESSPGPLQGSEVSPVVDLAPAADPEESCQSATPVSEGLPTSLTAMRRMRYEEDLWRSTMFIATQRDRLALLDIFWSRLCELGADMHLLWVLLQDATRHCSERTQAQNLWEVRSYGSSLCCECCRVPQHHMSTLAVLTPVVESTLLEILQLWLVASEHRPGECPPESNLTAQTLLSWVLGASEAATLSYVCGKWLSHHGSVRGATCTAALPSHCSPRDFMDSVHLLAGQSYDAMLGLERGLGSWEKTSKRLNSFWVCKMSRMDVVYQIRAKKEHLWKDLIVPLLSRYEDLQASVAVLQYLESAHKLSNLKGGFLNTAFRSLHCLLRDTRRLERSSLLFHVYPKWSLMTTPPSVASLGEVPPDEEWMSTCSRDAGFDAWDVAFARRVLSAAASVGSFAASALSIAGRFVERMLRKEGNVPLPYVLDMAPPPCPSLDAVLKCTLVPLPPDLDEIGADMSLFLRSLALLMCVDQQAEEAAAAIQAVQRQMLDGLYNAGHLVRRHVGDDDQCSIDRFRQCPDAYLAADDVSISELIAREVLEMTCILSEVVYPVQEFFFATAAEQLLEHLPATVSEATAFHDYVQHHVTTVSKWRPNVQLGQRLLVSLSTTASSYAERLPKRGHYVAGIPVELQDALAANAASFGNVAERITLPLLGCLAWMDTHGKLRNVDPGDGETHGRYESAAMDVEFNWRSGQEPCGDVLANSAVTSLQFHLDEFAKSITGLRSLGLVSVSDS